MVHKHIPAEGDVGLGAVFRSLGGFLDLLWELATQVEDGERRRPGGLVDEKVGLVDVFDEDDHLLVVAELPGVAAIDVGFEVKADVLELSAARGDRKYRKEVVLPSAVRARAAASSYRNGVLVLRLRKEG